jgi:hypothetical protein
MIADTKSEVIEIWNRRTPQPSGLPAAKDERDAFEAYCKQPFLDYPVRQRDYDGGYVDSTTQDIWVGWQARAALYDRPQPARAALTDEQAYKLLDEAVDFSENFAGGSTTELSKDAVSAILVRRLLAMAASQPQEPK